jgi:5-methylcytosine-specific restriction endonuclease McrA
MIAKKHTKLYEWLLKCKEKNAQCVKCGDKRLLSVDHIVPVSLIKQFLIDSNSDYDAMYNMEDNFQILCKYCNAMKRDSIDVKNIKTFEVLEKVIKECKTFYHN